MDLMTSPCYGKRLKCVITSVNTLIFSVYFDMPVFMIVFKLYNEPVVWCIYVSVYLIRVRFFLIYLNRFHLSFSQPGDM